ncbi:phosphotransferase family protein [Thermotalea metallivorans]|uniref:Aminoglycoside phosphotransferase domain-containing protein n=1 Tax=Thermotalea metallivorans TaxID=520762 RepID=A0A140KZY8_9FIRM|nr:phosphotransferase [Thermotalea metallivorans]KXG73863.1 hypothetical protein AN619_27830 [Thermotalea metallivorans]
MLRDTFIDKIKNYLLERDLHPYIPLKKDFQVEFLAQGEYNINFIVDDSIHRYVFRVNTGSQLELANQIKYEFDALKSLEHSGVTPKAFYIDDTKEYFDYGILMMEYLEGRPLAYHKDLKKAAEIFSRIHSIDTKEISHGFIIEEKICTDRVEEGRRWLKDYLKSPMVDIKLKNFFEKFLDWAEQNKDREKYFIENKWHVINNTEVNSHNFIIGKKQSYLIDWEKPVISDPCQDLAQFLAPTTTLWKADYRIDSDEKEMFFQSYAEGFHGKDNHIRERVHLYTPYLYLRALSWCAHAWLEYQNPHKEIRNMDTFQKIKQYLDIDFMKNLLKDYMFLSQ